MIKSNHHPVSIVVHAENIAIDRTVFIAYKTGNAVVIIQRSDKWSLPLCRICRNKPFPRFDIENIRNRECTPLTGCQKVDPPGLHNVLLREQPFAFARNPDTVYTCDP